MTLHPDKLAGYIKVCVPDSARINQLSLVIRLNDEIPMADGDSLTSRWVKQVWRNR